MNKDEKAFKKLVERATPKKVKPFRRIDTYNIQFHCDCGLMTIIYDDINFCPNCGQALDWKD